jgi:hypothetical protein
VVATVLLVGVLPVGTAGADTPPQVKPGCVGGVAPNPSVEELAANQQPAGYTFEPTWPVPPGTPADQQPRLYTDPAQAVDGRLDAVVSTPPGRVSTAFETIPTVIPRGTYHLTVWAGTPDVAQNQPVGLRFYDQEGRQVAERSVQADHDTDTDGKLGRFDPGPDRFFATTNANWVTWDCVYLAVDPPDSRWPTAPWPGPHRGHRGVARPGSSPPPARP